MFSPPDNAQQWRTCSSPTWLKPSSRRPSSITLNQQHNIPYVLFIIKAPPYNFLSRQSPRLPYSPRQCYHPPDRRSVLAPWSTKNLVNAFGRHRSASTGAKAKSNRKANITANSSEGIWSTQLSWGRKSLPGGNRVISLKSWKSLQVRKELTLNLSNSPSGNRVKLGARILLEWKKL